MNRAMQNPLRPWEVEAPGTERFVHDAPFDLESGAALARFELAYETWGELNDAKDNAILLHTGLSASSHAKSHAKNPASGWWESVIGHGRALDTSRYFIICVNVLGGCFGSTGPSSTHPMTGRPYASDFPIVSLEDMLRAQALLLDDLEIERLALSVGSSLGGMQSLMMAALFPDRVARLASISASIKSYPQTIAMRYVQRAAIMADPDWQHGRYYDKALPHRGMKVAREIGTITYRSGPEWDQRFGRARNPGPPTLGVDFEIESYLSYQGAQFCTRYDANSLLYIGKAMDLFDVEARAADIKARALVVGVTSDVLFPVWQQREVAEMLEAHVPVRYEELDEPTGHDTFLIRTGQIGTWLRELLLHDA